MEHKHYLVYHGPADDANLQILFGKWRLSGDDHQDEIVSIQNIDQDDSRPPSDCEERPPRRRPSQPFQLFSLITRPMAKVR